MKRAYFSPELFKFLKDLKKNNEKPWFEQNKDRYERHLRAPMLEFIGDFGSRLAKISKNFRADPRPNGGSLFRIYRDVRFSKDKTPYKTQASAHFRHAEVAHVHAPGFYLHLEPGECFLGVGIWHPDPPAAGKIRDAIVERPAAWKKALADKKFRARHRLTGETLVRPPRGYDPAHPLIEDLKRKDFVAVANFSEKDACGTGFMDDFSDACRAASPFMKFLTEAVGLEY